MRLLVTGGAGFIGSHYAEVTAEPRQKEIGEAPWPPLP